MQTREGWPRQLPETTACGGGRHLAAERIRTLGLRPAYVAWRIALRNDGLSSAEVTERRTHGSLRSYARPVAFGLAVVMGALAGIEFVAIGAKVVNLQGALGVDFHQYQDHARRWLVGGGFYLPAQLDGPYSVWALLPPLYPPTFLLLIVPFLWLPEIVWWAIPLVVLAYVLARLRPAWWSWPLLAVCALWPRSLEIIWYGNPAMWAAAAVAAGALWPWAAPFALLKPTLAPFAFVNVKRRSWWAGLGVFALLSLPFGSMWLDYVAVVRNATDTGLTYSLRDIPLVLLPVIAWWARRWQPVPHGRRRHPSAQ